MKNLNPYWSGLGLLVIGIAAFFIILGNPVKDFQLMSRGVTVQGIATQVNDFEDREDNGNVSRYFIIKYEFATPEGEKISDVVEVQGRPSDKGFRTGQALEIQYLANDPNTHRLKALASTTLTTWILKHLLFALLAIAPGCYFIKNGKCSVEGTSYRLQTCRKLGVTHSVGNGLLSEKLARRLEVQVTIIKS